MTTVHALTVRELLSDPARWTKGTYARNSEGEPVESNDPKAVCWCLLGAIHKCGVVSAKITELCAVAHNLKYLSISVMNDKMTHKELMEIVERLEL